MRPASRLEASPRAVEAPPSRPALLSALRDRPRGIRVSLFWQIGAGYLVAIILFFVIRAGVEASELTGARRWVIEALLMAGVAIGLAVFTRKINGRLKALNRYALLISRGDLSRPITVEPSRFTDEIDELAAAIQLMQQNLRELTGHIQHTARAQAESAEHMQRTTEDVNAQSEEVASSMGGIARGAELQKGLVERTSKLIGLIAESIERTARHAEEAARAAADSSSTAQQGGQAAQLAGEKIKRVFAQVERASQMVFAFGERTQEISKIVEAITNVANQTHLLALNATIEAARAGEYGRGFAVVADEVRKLAESAGASAQEIRRLAGEIQAGSREIVAAMEEGTAELKEGREDVDTIVKSMERIVRTAMRGAEKVEVISAAAREQLKGSEEMVRAVTNINQVAQDNARATEEVQRAIRAQNAATAHLTSAAQELINLSLELQAVASRFNLG